VGAARRRGTLGRCWRVRQLETDYALFETELPRPGHTLVVRVAPALHGNRWECSHLIKTEQGFTGEVRSHLPGSTDDYLAVLGRVERSLDRG